MLKINFDNVNSEITISKTCECKKTTVNYENIHIGKILGPTKRFDDEGICFEVWSDSTDKKFIVDMGTHKGNTYMEVTEEEFPGQIDSLPYHFLKKIKG